MALLLGAYLFLLALLFALVEIEVEGRYGWAERLPTWYRTTGPARIFSLFSSGKPLTGYHLFMQLFMLAAFHLPFFAGLAWSVASELRLLAALVLFFIAEDFLWFVFNPAYGVRNFRKGKIWWHSTSVWVFGLFPLDYATGLATSLIFASLAALLAENSRTFLSWLGTLGVVLLLIFLSSLFARPYARWYKRMRKRDDRGKAGIFH